MGTTSQKLTYLNGTKQELKQKINNLGGSIDDNTTFRNYANQLQNVYDNLPKTEYQEGTEVNLGVTSKGKLDYENGVVGIGQSEQNSTTGKNLFNINTITEGKGIRTTDGAIYNNESFNLSDYIQVNVGTTYYMSWVSDSSYFACVANYYDENQDLLSTVALTRNGFYGNTFTPPENAKYIRVSYSIVVSSVPVTREYIQIEVGSGRTSYEPYTGGIPSPNPSYDEAINSVTGNQDVVVSGKNLLDLSQFTSQEQYDVTFTKNTDGSIKISGTSTHSITIDVPVSISLKSNTTYINSQGNTYTANYYSLSLRKDGTVIASNSVDSGNTSKSFTPTEDIVANAYRIYIANGKEIDITIYPMIIENTSTTTYEPYITPTSYQLSLGDKQLYGDSFIDRDSNGDWYFNDNYIKELFKNGSISRKTTNTTGVYRFSIEFTNPAKPIDNSDVADIKSNIFVAITANNTYSKVQGVAINNAGSIYFYGDDFKSYTQAEMTTYFSTKNDYIVYPLNTPIRTKITDETLINQLNAWYNAHSNNGATIITSNGNLPMIIKVRGLKGE